MKTAAWETQPGQWKTPNEMAALLLVVGTMAVPLGFSPGFLPWFLWLVAVLAGSVALAYWKPRGVFGMSISSFLRFGSVGILTMTLLVVKETDGLDVPFYGFLFFGTVLASLGWSVPNAAERRLFCLTLYLPVTLLMLWTLRRDLPAEQQEWVWLAFVVAALLLVWVVGAASPSGKKFRLSPSWGVGLRAMAVVLAVSMLLSVPVSAVRMKMKDVACPSFFDAPTLSTSSDVVFSVQFDGRVPEAPYWRGAGLIYPAPANAYGDWMTHKTVFGKSFAMEDVKILVEGHYVSSYKDEAKPAADYSFRTFMGRGALGMGIELDGTFDSDYVKEEEKRNPDAASEYQGWASDRFIRNKYGDYDFLSATDRKKFYEELHKELGPYVEIPGFSPSEGKVPSEMDQTYALVQQILAELKAQGKITGPLTVASDPEEKAAFLVAIYTYFSKHLKYNFDHQYLQQDKNTLDYFLFEDQRGVCRHFANAFASMVRMGGVPSRVVAGFRGGVYEEATKTFYVRKRDAHAWTEVWMGEQGWVQVDPTSAVPVEKGIPEDSVVAKWKEGMGFAKGVLSKFSTAGKMDVASGASSPPILASLWDWIGRQAFWLASVAGVALAGFLVLALLRLRDSRREVCPIQESWLALLAMVRRFGYVVPENMGPATIKPLLAQRLEGDAWAVWSNAVDGYEQWRFAGQAVPGLERQLRQATRTVRVALKKAARPG
jgi:transglutaminase-like putative cysteine protease